MYLYLSDFPDVEPQFERAEYFFQIDENPSMGFYIGQVKARDGDVDINWPIEYFTDDTFLKIDKTTGRISVEDPTYFDRENFNEIQVEIWAIEKPIRTYIEELPMNKSTNIIISLRDKNDEPPFFEIKKDSVFSIMENRGVGAEINGPQENIK